MGKTANGEQSLLNSQQQGTSPELLSSLRALEVVKVQWQRLTVFVQGDHRRASRGLWFAGLFFFFAERSLLGLFGLPLLAGALFCALGKCSS